MKAAQKTFRQCAFHETLDYTKKGLQIAATLPESRQRSELELNAQLLTAVALSSSKGYASPDTKGAFDRAYTICRAVRDDVLLFQSLAGFWSFHLIRGEINDALKFARKMLDLAGRNKSGVFKLNAHMAAGCAFFYQGHARSTHEHLEQALHHYDVEYHRKSPSLFGWDPGVVSHCYDAQALWFIGFPTRAERSAEQARTLARKLQSPFNDALCHGLLSLYYAYRDDSAKLLDTTAAGIRVSTEGGFLHWLALTTLLHGSALCKTGRVSEGILQLGDGIEKWRSIGTELGLPSTSA
jgi:predicted ATPase